MFWRSFCFFFWPNAGMVWIKGNHSISGPRGFVNLCHHWTCMINAWPPHFFHCWFKFLWLSVSYSQPLDFVVFLLNGRAILYVIHSILYLNSVIILHMIEVRERILCISLVPSEVFICICDCYFIQFDCV